MVILPNIRRKYMEGRVPRGAPVPLSGCVVTLVAGSVAYTGGARTVGVTVTWNGDALTVNEDYTLSFANNVNIGPATVTVTGIGQFTGSVTKTFYIVDSSVAPWSFDLQNAEHVGSKSISTTNFNYMLPVVAGYNQNGGLVPVARGVSASPLVGFLLPKDSDGEYHVANIDTSDAAFSHAGPNSDYRIPFHFDNVRSFWLSSFGNFVLKADDGTESPDFSSVIANKFSMTYRPFFVNGGKKLFVPQENWKVCMFDLGTRYDISTVDLSSKRETVFTGASTYYVVQYAIFGNGGYEALVSVSNGSNVYHVSCPYAYDLTGATVISQVDFSSTVASVRAMTILNDGRTLMMSGSNGISEYELMA